jgi:hypothetical protein
VVFHDSTDRAQQAVPWLMANTAQSGVTWEDCHIYPQQLADEEDNQDEEADTPDEDATDEETMDKTQEEEPVQPDAKATEAATEKKAGE